MNKENSTKRGKSASHLESVAPVMSQIELAKLGGGHVAYLKILSSDDAKRIFPAIEGLPAGVSLYSLHAADGTPIALTDTRQAALSHAFEGELLIASLH